MEQNERLMDFLGAAEQLKFDNYLTCCFDLCPLLEPILYSLQSLGGTLFCPLFRLERCDFQIGMDDRRVG